MTERQIRERRVYDQMWGRIDRRAEAKAKKHGHIFIKQPKEILAGNWVRQLRESRRKNHKPIIQNRFFSQPENWCSYCHKYCEECDGCYGWKT